MSVERSELMDVLHEMSASHIEIVCVYAQRVKYALKEHDQAVVDWARTH